jgi:pimeloyl-ACP methyl ester carboxylesterase
MGAALAVLYAVARPERVSALILVESLLPSQRSRAEAAEQLVTHLDSLNATLEHPVFPDVESAARRQRQGMPGLSEERALRLAHRITEPAGGGVRWRWDVTIQSRAGIAFHGLLDGDLANYRQILGRVHAPVTLVNGMHSLMTREETIQVHRESLRVVREASLNGGHHLLIDAPGPLAEIISEAALLVHCAAMLSGAGPDSVNDGTGPITPPGAPGVVTGGSSERFAEFPPERAIPDSLSRVES